MKILKLFVMPALLMSLTSSVYEPTEFNTIEINDKIHIESNNHGSPLLGTVIEDKGIPLLDVVIEDKGISLLHAMHNDDSSL